MSDTVFLVFHSYENIYGNDQTKFIGVYNSEDTAKGAVGRLKHLPGFCLYPEGFSIDAHTINKDNWVSGFVGNDDDWPLEE